MRWELAIANNIPQDVLHRMGIPAEFHNLSLTNDLKTIPTLKDFEIIQYSKIYSSIEKWVDVAVSGKSKNGLLLMGISGCGKTAVGSTICRKFLRDKKIGRRMTLFEIGEQFFEGAWKVPEEVFEEGVLFIDEISRIVPTKPGFNESILDHILRRRTESYLPTVLSSVQSRAALEMLHGDSVCSLIYSKFFEVLFPKVNLTIRIKDSEEKKIFNGGSNDQTGRT